jgi:hypothetical protein
MIGNRSLSLNRSTLVIVGLAALAGLAVLIAMNLGGQGVPAASPAGFPAAGDLTGLRPVEAYAARWGGLAGAYALQEETKRAHAVQMQYLAGNTARSVEAHADQSAGVAELPSRSVVAYGARWAGLADAYLGRQQAVDAYGRRLPGPTTGR